MSRWSANTFDHRQPLLTVQQTIAYHNHLLQMVWSDEHGEVVGVAVKPTSDIAASLSCSYVSMLRSIYKPDWKALRTLRSTSR